MNIFVNKNNDSKIDFGLDNSDKDEKYVFKMYRLMLKLTYYEFNEL